MFIKAGSSGSSSEESVKLCCCWCWCCCFSVSMLLLLLLMSGTRLRVVVGPAATLGLVLDEADVGPPDDIFSVSKRRRVEN